MRHILPSEVGVTEAVVVVVVVVVVLSVESPSSHWLDSGDLGLML